LGDAQAVLEAPAEEVGVAGGEEKAGAVEGGRGGDEGFEIVVGLADRVAEEADGAGVPRDAAAALDDERKTLLDHVAGLIRALEAVHFSTHSVARFEVGEHRRAYLEAGNRALHGWALHARERLAYVEAELRVEGQRSIVESRLHEAHADGALFFGAIQDRLHEPATDGGVLHRGVDRDRADAGDRVALVEAIAADDLPVALGDDDVESRVLEDPAQEARGDVGRRKIGREVVLRRDVRECVVADTTARIGVGGGSGS